MTGAATNWNFQLGSTANPYRVTSSNINIAVAGSTQIASVGSLTQSFAIGAAQAAATAAAAEEAANTFGTDSVAGSGQYIHEEQPAAVLAAVARLDQAAR